jgi:hypothetical protein
MRHAERHGLDNKTVQDVLCISRRESQRKIQKQGIVTIKSVRGLTITARGNVSKPWHPGAAEAM